VLRRLVLLCAALALVASMRASGHEGGTHSGFAARVSVIDPFLPGLLVTVVGGHEQLSVTNLTEKNVVILDDVHRPFVHIAPGRTEVWSEPRIGANEQPPETDGLVRNWRIAGTADGEPFQIVGFLGYRAPQETDDGDGSSLLPYAVVLTVGGVAVAALLLVGRRRSRRV
jgi:hypothetical protein